MKEKGQTSENLNRYCMAF